MDQLTFAASLVADFVIDTLLDINELDIILYTTQEHYRPNDQIVTYSVVGVAHKTIYIKDMDLLITKGKQYLWTYDRIRRMPAEILYPLVDVKEWNPLNN